MAPERPPEPRSRGFRGVLTRKIGPLPTWVWVLLITAMILAWVVLKGRKGKKAQPPASSGGRGQVPQFVNQTYTTVSPPPAPDQDGDEDEGDEDVRGRKIGPPVTVPPHHPKPHRRRPHPPRDRATPRPQLPA